MTMLLNINYNESDTEVSDFPGTVTKQQYFLLDYSQHTTSTLH